jgi:arylsulfatase A-like enzyme
MLPSTSSTGFALAALGLCFLAACEQPVPYQLRRVPLDDRHAEILETAGVTRPGLRLEAGEDSVATELAALTAGRITIFVAPSGDAAYGGQVDVDLRETGWRAWTGTALQQRCSVRWGEPGTPESAPWQRCTFELPRGVERALLRLTRSSPADGELLVSDVRVEGRAARQVPDVFVLLLDAARFDGLRPFREDAGVGNNLSALARDSVLLRNLRSSSSWTRPAIATLFTGLRADRHRVLDRSDVLSGDASTLAEMLRDRGYSTAAWSTNPNVLPVWGLARGFDTFVDQGSHSWGSGKTDGAAVVSRMRAALADRGPEPVFYYAHLMDPHAPYQPSEEQRETVAALPGIQSWFPRPLAILAAPNDWKAFVDYTGELLDTDNHVGTFVQTLKDAGLYDDALLLVLADHGEEFIDHGGRDHGRTLYEEVLRIPAMIKLPGNRFAGTAVEESTSLVDVLPTLLAGLGLELPPGLDGAAIPLDGREDDAPTPPAVASLQLDGRRQSAIFDPPWKLIRNDLLGGRELYNLDDDPRERKNLVLWHPETAAKLQGALDLILSHGQEGWHLLLCGTLEESGLDLMVQPSSGTVTPFGFEDGEATTSPDQPGVWRLRPQLSPVTVERPAFGKLAKVVVAEQNELLIVPDGSAPASKLGIRTEPGSSFDYRTGVSGPLRTATRLVLDSRSDDVVHARSTRIECTTTEAGGAAAKTPARPFLRVWYVPPVAKVATEKLDPMMRERLRALGYLQ